MGSEDEEVEAIKSEVAGADDEDNRTSSTLYVNLGEILGATTFRNDDDEDVAVSPEADVDGVVDR